MYLCQLNIHHLRNIQEARFEPGPRFNVLYGQNGSGKTSVLEAIYLLSVGRSFRTLRALPLITLNHSSTVVSGVVRLEDSASEVTVGVERFQDGHFKIRLGEYNCPSIAELAKTLPTQVINTDSYGLLHSSPKLRRQFLDWGVFHVEHSFFSAWQRYKRTLQQRNRLLRQFHRMSPELQAWDKELIETGEIIHHLRQNYWEQWMPVFLDIAQQLTGLQGFTPHYHPGWKVGQSLEVAVSEASLRDREEGYTSVGPHRAEWQITIQGMPAKEWLSRGQLKLLICALFIARAKVLQEKIGVQGLFLLDDLPSELDQGACQRLIHHLIELGGQVFLTGVETSAFASFLEEQDVRWFHVEHGLIHA